MTQTQEKVMLIDDESSVAQAISFLLSTMDYSVDSYENGLDALENFADRIGGYKCAFVDLTMPGIDGLETRRRIREISPAFPIVLTTGYSDETIPDAILEDPHTLFLKKPFSVKNLTECLKQLPQEDS